MGNRPASSAPASGSDVLSSGRLAQFREEVENLRVTGGTANPERAGSRWGLALMGIGAVVAIVAIIVAMTTKGSTNKAISDELRAVVIAGAGAAIAVVGAALWVRNSLTRYFRYWLIRLVYEQREQTDRLIEALERERR